MTTYKIISGDTHIVEPPDLYTSRMTGKCRDRAPYIKRQKTADGKDSDAWFLGDTQVVTLGAVTQAGRRFDDPEKIDFVGIWEDVREGAYQPDAMLRELEFDGIWGAIIQPSQGLFWYHIEDSELLSGLCQAYNDWIADFCKPHPDRLKGIGMLNVDNVAEACAELERSAKLGLAGMFIPVTPTPGQPYRDPVYNPLWAKAADLDIPLLMHLATQRANVPGCEISISFKTFTPKEGLLPSDYWRRNLFAVFQEDDVVVQLRHRIGIDNLMWGNDFPHSESTWPKSREFLSNMFTDVPEAELRKLTCDNAARIFHFSLS